MDWYFVLSLFINRERRFEPRLLKQREYQMALTRFFENFQKLYYFFFSCNHQYAPSIS